MLAADMQKAIEKRMRAISIFDTLGFEIVEIDEGRCVARVPRQPQFDGAFETFHGGIVQTACDSLAWATILTKAGPDAYLATTPGGLYAVLAAAFGAGTDTTFVLAVQTLRVLVMVLLAPAVVRVLVRWGSG